MKVTLSYIDLSYYKCFMHKGVGFAPERAFITGRNGTGKSTLMDAYFDVLTGKMADGTSPDNVRPIDTGDTETNSPDVFRELTLEIDGKRVVLSKNTRAKWRRPRGSATAVFDGNETTYQVDGFETASRKYEADIADLIAPQDILLYLSNARPFLNMNTVDRRKILERLSGFSLADFIQTHPEYAKVQTMLAGHTAEDVLKKLRKQLAQQNKAVDQKRTELRYEQARVIEDINLSVIKAEQIAIQKELDKLEAREKELDAQIKGADKKAAQLRDLQRRLETLTKEARQAAVRAYVQACDERDKLIRDMDKLRQDIETLERRQAIWESDMGEAHQRRAECADEWNDEQAKQFDETETVCAYCGQPLPQEQVDAIRQKFEAGKQRKLDRIIENGKQAAARKDECIENIRKVQIQIAELKGVLDSTRLKLKEAESKCTDLRSVEVAEPVETVELRKQIAELKEQMLAETDNSMERSDIRARATLLYSRLSELGAKATAHDMALAQHTALLERLEDELKNIIQLAADIERDIDLIGEFSRAKNEALASKVNAVMQGIQFRLLEFTIEGNPVETCKIIGPGGVEYAGLNQSSKYIAEAELVRGFQRMYGIDLPIWMDEVESIDIDRIPVMDTQMIYIKHSEGDLVVSDSL